MTDAATAPSSGLSPSTTTTLTVGLLPVDDEATTSSLSTPVTSNSRHVPDDVG